MAMLSKVARSRKAEWLRVSKFFTEDCLTCGIDCEVTNPGTKSGFNLGNCPKVTWKKTEPEAEEHGQEPV